MPPPSTTASVSRRPPLLAWSARVALLVAAPLLCLGALELALRLGGCGQDLRLFVPDERPGFARTNRAFTSVFAPAAFALQPVPFRIAQRKPAGTRRIFVLGESAAMGIPCPEFGFVSQLRPLLQARHPEAKIEVYNLGITAINSHVIYQVAQELARFEPDLLLIYAGNNEVVGPYGPGSFYSHGTPPAWLVRASVAAKRTRTGQLLGRLLAFRAAPARDWQGMKMFAGSTVHADDPRLAAVYRNFTANLTDILALAADQHVPVVLGTVVANLQDCAPFVSVHEPELTSADLARWQKHFDAGVRSWRIDRPSEVCAPLTEALKIDSRHADTYYLLGRAELALGRTAEARVHLQQALHFDALRFRPDTPINEIVRAAAHRAPGHVTLVDTARMFGSDPQSVAPVAGRELLIDHVHFTWDGDYAMARQFAAACEATLFPPATTTDWLSSEQVAAAIGFNPVAQLRLLNGINEQSSVEPFTGQITYAEDRRRRQQEILRLWSSLSDHQSGELLPDRLAQATERVANAVAADPQNPALRRLLLELHASGNDVAACLADTEVLATLLPASDSLATGHAKLLARLGRTSQARPILAGVLARDPGAKDAFEALMQLEIQTGARDEVVATLQKRLIQESDNEGAAQLLASLLVQNRDPAGALAVLTAVFARRPDSAASLALLCHLHEQTGRGDLIPEVRLRAAAAQPRNSQNNAYLADWYEQSGDTANAARFLQALADSGDADSNQLLRLAKARLALGRRDDAAVVLWQAKRAAAAEGDTGRAERLEKLFDNHNASSAGRR